MNIIIKPGNEPAMTVEAQAYWMVGVGRRRILHQLSSDFNPNDETLWFVKFGSRPGLLHQLRSDFNPNDKRPYGLANLGP